MDTNYKKLVFSNKKTDRDPRTGLSRNLDLETVAVKPMEGWRINSWEPELNDITGNVLFQFFLHSSLQVSRCFGFRNVFWRGLFVFCEIEV